MKKLFFISLCILCIGAYAQDAALITGWTVQENIYPEVSGTAINPQMGSAAIVGDYLYVIGGNNGYDGDTARVIKFQIDPYTGSVTFGVETTTLPTSANFCYLYETVDVFNDFIYIGGGGYNSTGPNRDEVTYIKSLSSGDLDTAWTESTAFPTTPRVYDPELGGMVITEAGYLYMFGGDGEATTTFDECYYAKVNTDGSLGAWQTGTTLPNTFWFPGVCAVGNDIIVHGGILDDKASANSTDKIWVCQTSGSDGSMGSWVEQTEKLPMTHYNGSMVAAGNTIFMVGGRIPGDGDSRDTVWRATYDAGTHTVGAWTQVDAQLPVATQYHQAVYSPESKSIYVTNIRNRFDDNATNFYPNAVYISSPLFDRPAILSADNAWSLYE